MATMTVKPEVKPVVAYKPESKLVGLIDAALDGKQRYDDVAPIVHSTYTKWKNENSEKSVLVFWAGFVPNLPMTYPESYQKNGKRVSGKAQLEKDFPKLKRLFNLANHGARMAKEKDPQAAEQKAAERKQAKINTAKAVGKLVAAFRLSGTFLAQLVQAVGFSDDQAKAAEKARLSHEATTEKSRKESAKAALAKAAQEARQRELDIQKAKDIASTVSAKRHTIKPAPAPKPRHLAGHGPEKKSA